jgi:hypothetical protein
VFCDQLLPEDESYLLPYDVLFADEDDIPSQSLREPPESHNDLTTQIQRFVDRITYQVQTLSDLKVTYETLHWQIRVLTQGEADNATRAHRSIETHRSTF